MLFNYETVVCDTSFTQADFELKLAQIVADNSDRKDVKEYALYGAFHEWKGVATNFHDTATTILKSETIDATEQAMAYTHLVLSTAKLWLVFCERVEAVPPLEAVTISNKYVSRELDKIAHRLKKAA
jgi:hypothetical protein